jgi:hypothetical protein
LKRQFAIGALLALFLSLSSFASAQITLVARLTGAQETPPTASTGTGLAVLTLDASKTHLTYDLAVSGLTDITASHIHRGATGVAGPIVIPITAGPFSYATATVAVTPDEVDDLLSGNMYVNVHTAANPGGEIRGQIGLPDPKTYIALVNGAQETPPTDSTAKGIGLFTLDATNENVTWEVVLADLANMTASHIHLGAVGVAGPIIVPISAGPYTYSTGTGAVTPDQATALQSGGTYFNAHTTAHPGGEIRGQILPPLDGPSVTLIARLSGAQETPPNTSTGTGLAVLSLNASHTSLTYDLAVSGLTDITASHIHRGGVGIAGPILFPITSGPFSYASGTVSVTPDDVNNLLSGNMYVNVHTAANPGGEIRGQIVISDIWNLRCLGKRSAGNASQRQRGERNRPLYARPGAREHHVGSRACEPG